MSFDWLNVPGLVLTDENKRESRIVPPNVSFDFNIPLNTGVTSAPVSNAPTPEPVLNNLAAPAPAPYTSNKSNNPFSSSDTALQNYTTTASSIVSNTSTTTDTQQNQDQEYHETPEDLKVPLSLSQTQLTQEELKTYLRWYKCITLRTHSKLVRLQDVFTFLSNFSITDSIKARIQFIFRSCKNALNIGQFFAVLRLVSRALAGLNANGSGTLLPSRRMLLERAPIPQPRSILSSESKREVYEEVDVDDDDDDYDGGEGNSNNNFNGSESGRGNGGGKGVDFDSFTSLLLTGKTARKRIRRKILNEVYRNKKVRFSEHVTFQDPPSFEEGSGPTTTVGGGGMSIGNDSSNDTSSSGVDSAASQGPLDLSLPMDQLLKLLEKRKNNSALVSTLPSEQTETEEEREELKDMQDSLSHFKQIQTVDSVAVAGAGYGFPPGFLGNSQGYTGGNGMTGGQPPLEPLKPTATGSANHFMRQEYNQIYSGSQNSGVNDTEAQNTNTPLQPLKPTATGSANYLVRSQMGVSNIKQQQSSNQYPTFNTSNSPDNSMNNMKNTSDINQTGTNILQPLKPTATGSANYLVRQQQQQQQPQQPQQPTFASSYMMQQQNPAPSLSTHPTSTNDEIMRTNVDSNIHIAGRTFQSPDNRNQTQQPSQFMNFPQHRAYMQQQQQQQQQTRQQQRFQQPPPPPPPQTHLQPQRQIQPQNQQYQQQPHNVQPPMQQNIQGQAGYTTPTTPQGPFQGNFPQQMSHMRNQNQQQGGIMSPYSSRSNDMLQPQQAKHQPQPQQLQPPRHVQFPPSNLLSPQSTAGSYFQSLLTHTPSPSMAQEGGATSRNGTGGSNLMPQPMYYGNSGNSSSSINLPDGSASRNGTGGSNITPQPTYYNNNNTNYNSGIIPNNNVQRLNPQPYHRQMQQQQQQQQQQLQQPLPNIQINSNIHQVQSTISSVPTNYYGNVNTSSSNNAGIPGQRIPIQNSNMGAQNYAYGGGSATDSPNLNNQGRGNILGNYQAMQQEINSLNGAYNKRQ